MGTWGVLVNELKYYGIRIVNDRECQVYDIDNTLKKQGIVKTIRQINKNIAEHRKSFISLWEEVSELLQIPLRSDELIDERMSKLFIFSLKDMSKFLLCFEELDNSKYSFAITSALNNDVKNFSKSQIYQLSDYKITIDWTYRQIQRLMYVKKLLSFASVGQKKISRITIKMARGVSGPWANLDLPLLERVFPYEELGLKGRDKDKRHQRRYRKGFENYNGDGRVSEGHYWREIKNEPFLWSERGSEDPYPHRNLLN